MPHTPSLPSLAWHLAAPPFPCQNPSDQPPGSAFFLLPLVSSLIPTGPEYACTPTPSRPHGPASLFSSETANPQLSFSPFCSGPGHQSHLLMSGPNPPPPRSASVLPVWPSQVSVTAGAVLPAFAFGLFPRQLHPQSPPVQLHRMIVPVPCPFALFKIFRHLRGINSLGLLRSECVHVITHHPSTI